MSILLPILIVAQMTIGTLTMRLSIPIGNPVSALTTTAMPVTEPGMICTGSIKSTTESA